MPFDRAIIETYVAGGQKLRAAMVGLSSADLNAIPVPGTWSIQQIVVHLMDSDLIWSSRMKLIIAEDRPTILGYDESKFAKSLAYDRQPVEDAVTLFELNRRLFAGVLRTLPDAAFDRVGLHNEAGEISLGKSIATMVNHLDHHLEFVAKKRAMLGR